MKKVSGQLSLFDIISKSLKPVNDYSTLPLLCGRHECMYRQVTYLGEGDESKKLQRGEKYEVKWKADRFFDGAYQFLVLRNIITRINKNGKKEGYQLVVHYENPQAIVRDWDFEELRTWCEGGVSHGL